MPTKLVIILMFLIIVLIVSWIVNASPKYTIIFMLVIALMCIFIALGN